MVRSEAELKVALSKVSVDGVATTAQIINELDKGYGNGYCRCLEMYNNFIRSNAICGIPEDKSDKLFRGHTENVCRSLMVPNRLLDGYLKHATSGHEYELFMSGIITNNLKFNKEFLSEYNQLLNLLSKFFGSYGVNISFDGNGNLSKFSLSNDRRERDEYFYLTACNDIRQGLGEEITRQYRDNQGTIAINTIRFATCNFMEYKSPEYYKKRR